MLKLEPKTKAASVVRTSRIRNVCRRERERDRGGKKRRRLSTSFCWICFIKNDKLGEGKRRRRENIRVKRGERRRDTRV